METNLNNIWQKCTWQNLQQNYMQQMWDLFVQRRLVRTTYDGRRGVLDARRRPSRLCFSQFATRTVDHTVDLYAAKPDIRPESSFLPTPPAFDAPVRRVPVGISPSRLARKNYRMGREDIFIRFYETHERNRHTNTQTA